MHTIENLRELMARLRRPADGCPWDLKQNYRSIVPSTIEEVYELVAAIENQDFDNLKEELGDLLFQVVFYARLAEEEQRFDLCQVIDGLVEKLLRRHPHVFPDGTLQSCRDKNVSVPEAAIKQNWEKIKEKERGQKGLPRLMDDIPVALPAMTRAVKLQKRAAKVGFDWNELSAVVDKVKEELAELEDAIAKKSVTHIEDELGDLFFTCVSLSRHLAIDPEQSLRRASSKFQHRMQYIEAEINKTNNSFSDFTEEELDLFWEQAKAHLARE